MTVKEVYAILKELEDHVEDTCCSVTMDQNKMNTNLHYDDIYSILFPHYKL